MVWSIQSNRLFNVYHQLTCMYNRSIYPRCNYSIFRKDGFVSFKTNCYKLNYYETLTGLKFILNTDNNVGNIRDTLHQLYSTVSAE
jgi:hypothetical protein